MFYESLNWNLNCAHKKSQTAIDNHYLSVVLFTKSNHYTCSGKKYANLCINENTKCS